MKLDKNEIVTLNLTKVVPKIFDERLPYRGFLKGELENITKLKIWDEKLGPGGWVSVDHLKHLDEKKFVIEYKTKDVKEIVPEIEPSIIEKDVDISQDININPEKFAKSLNDEELNPEVINRIISERAKLGRRLVINAEVNKDPFGRFRYTKVRLTSGKDLHFEEEMAIKAVNVLITKYRRITRDYWITKVREEDFFMKTAEESKDLREERRLTVQKRNGRLEPFNEEKMIRSISRAGTPFLIAKDISKLLRNNLDKNYDNTIISSNDLRSLIVEELKNKNQSTIAESYSGYKKNLITGTREELLHSRKYKSKVDSSFNTHANNMLKIKIIHLAEDQRLVHTKNMSRIIRHHR